VRGEAADPQALRAEFLSVAQELNVDIAFQEDSLFRRNRRLAVFDMDSTLIEAEVIDELAKAAGVGDRFRKSPSGRWPVNWISVPASRNVWRCSRAWMSACWIPSALRCA
jgi:hypothetical protein